jgi:hypothetical protein
MHPSRPPRLVRPETLDDDTWCRCVTLAASSIDPRQRAEHLLCYLETHPTGRYNRWVTEQVEFLIDEVPEPTWRELLGQRLRDIRDAVMEPLEPGSWSGDYPF